MTPCNKNNNRKMPVREVIVKPDSRDPYEIELFNYTAVFRALRFDIRFGVVAGTNVPIVASAPTEIPVGSPFICLYGCPLGSDLTKVTGVFSKVKDRLLSFKDHPARSDEFDNTQFLSCETIAHSTRLMACFEKDPERRAYLFQESYNIYEGLILASCHSSLIDMIKQVSRRGSGKAILFQPIPDMGILDPGWRRMLSHSFAGMALCSFLGFRDQRKYVSLVSASLCCELRRPLELASTLRLIPFLMCRGEYTIPWASGESSADNTLDGIFATASVCGVYMNITENVLIPTMLRVGRRDLFDVEIGFVEPEKRAACESFATAIVQRAIDRETVVVPTPFVSVRTHIVNGKIVERKCANCGEWDRTGRSHMRCSVCMQVYYCNKECQLAQWKTHKTVCCCKKKM